MKTHTPTATGGAVAAFGRNVKYTFQKKILPNYMLYLFLLPALIYLIILVYWPIYGVQIAFKDFRAGLGIDGSPWVGMKHFERFFNSYLFWDLLKNTLVLSFYRILAGFPLSVITAIAFQYCFSRKAKRLVQTVTYAPHFISQVVLVGILLVVLSPRSGIVNNVITAFGGEAITFMEVPSMFKHIYVWSGIWQELGFSSVLFIAALAGVNPELHEAAIVDGAGKLRRILTVDLPVLAPTIIIVLILDLGKTMSIGFEKIFLMQNDMNIMVSEVISTYVYKLGIQNAQYSFTTAIGLFNNVINLVLLLMVNTISSKLSKTSLF